MWLILAVLVTVALIVPVYLAIMALRRPSESCLTMNDDPVNHSPEQIKRGMESYWKKTAREQSAFLLKHIGEEEASVLAEYLVESIEILSVQSHDGDRATALVRILPTDSDTPSEVTLVQCVFRNWPMGVQHLDRRAAA